MSLKAVVCGSAATDAVAHAPGWRAWVADVVFSLSLLLTGAAPALAGDGITAIEQLKPADFEMTPPADRKGLDASTAAVVEVKSLGLDYKLGEPVPVRDKDGNLVRWRVPVSGTDPTKPPKATSLEFETQFLKDKSWWFEKEKFDETSEADMRLLQHEKGHAWIREIRTIAFNSVRETILQKMNADMPRVVIVDASDADTAAEATAVANSTFVTNRNAQAKAQGLKLTEATGKVTTKLEQDYDDETDHGSDADSQSSWKKKILEYVTPTKKDGSSEAKSEASKSLHFDPVTGQLLLTGDLITAIPGLPLDTLAGASVNFPVFHYEGQHSLHVPYFVAQGDDRITIEKGNDVFFVGQLPYLFYLDEQLTGFIVATLFEDFDSMLIDEYRSAFESGQPFLMGIQVLPDEDLDALTGGFVLAGSTPFTNLVFQAETIPEPATVALVAIGLIGLGFSAQRRRRAERRMQSTPICRAHHGLP